MPFCSTNRSGFVLFGSCHRQTTFCDMLKHSSDPKTCILHAVHLRRWRNAGLLVAFPLCCCSSCKCCLDAENLSTSKHIASWGWFLMPPDEIHRAGKPSSHGRKATTSDQEPLKCTPLKSTWINTSTNVPLPSRHDFKTSVHDVHGHGSWSAMQDANCSPETVHPAHGFFEALHAAIHNLSSPNIQTGSKKKRAPAAWALVRCSHLLRLNASST